VSFGRLERGSAPRPMGEINMTPLIDVMLVLLVIFMITAPLVTSSLKLDLPRTDAGTPGDHARLIAIAVDAQGRFYVGEQAVTREVLEQRVREAAGRHPRPDVMLRADRSVPYGTVAELVGLVQRAGLVRIGFVTEAPGPGR
jgi:biopolymer transport protein ExbD/biopolymer transport protein TolR